MEHPAIKPRQVLRARDDALEDVRAVDDVIGALESDRETLWRPQRQSSVTLLMMSSPRTRAASNGGCA